MCFSSSSITAMTNRFKGRKLGPYSFGEKVRMPTLEGSGNEGYSTKGVTILLEVKDSS